MAMSMSPGITPAQLIEEADQARTSLSQTKSFIAVLQQQRVSDEQKEAKEPDAQTAEVVAYLEAENAYKQEVMSATEDFQTKI